MMEASEVAAHFDQPLFRLIRDVAAESNTPAYAVGGYVRDLLLGRSCKDLDIVVEGSGIDFAFLLADRLSNTKVHYFKNFGTAMFAYGDMEIELVGARKESYRSQSRKPIVESATIEEDRMRRDFTINALSVSLNKADFGALIDPLNGTEHLKQKLLVTPLEPRSTFSDDPLRMMRAIRFATQLGFWIEDNCYAAITDMADRISIVSQERVTEELNKIVAAEKPSIGFKLLFNSGLLKHIFPKMVELHGVDVVEGKGHKDNFYHTLQVLDNTAQRTPNIWTRWAAILHDIAKPDTKRFDAEHGWTFHGHEEIGARMVPKIFRNLRLPMDAKMKYVQKLVRLHLRPIALSKDHVSESGIRRLLFDAGNDLDDLMLLCESDITSKNEYKVKRYRDNFARVREKLIEVEENDRIKNWEPPISGTQIMDTFGLKPGKEVGIIKKAIREAILEGEIPNSLEAATEKMHQEASKLGLNSNPK